MDQFDDELREIKREIVESRGLVIKTNNLTNSLAADIKATGAWNITTGTSTWSAKNEAKLMPGMTCAVTMPLTVLA